MGALTAHVHSAIRLPPQAASGAFAPPQSGHRRAPARDLERAAAWHNDNDQFRAISFAAKEVTTKR